MTNLFFTMIVPFIICGVALYGVARRVDVYDALVHGAGEGLETLVRIVPALIGLMTALAGKHPGQPYNLIVCDGNVPEEGAALERALTDALPRARRVVHGQIDATLAVHLGPNLLGAGIQFLDPEC